MEVNEKYAPQGMRFIFHVCVCVYVVIAHLDFVHNYRITYDVDNSRYCNARVLFAFRDRLWLII